jgi:hypothetical protein
MSQTAETLEGWLEQAGISQDGLTEQQQAVLKAAFSFRQRLGADYYSTRLLSHFLLHCDTGLKVAAVARLVGISRPTASEQQGVPSKDVIRSAAHRLAGRPYGKLLPRHAGPVAAFLVAQPDATRIDLLQFLKDTFAISVSRVALHKFLKKYGLDHIGPPTPPPLAVSKPQDVTPANSLPSAPIAAQTDPPVQLEVPAAAQPPGPTPPPVQLEVPAAAQPSGPTPGLILLPEPRIVPATLPAPPFCSGGRSMPAPSC